LTIEWFHAATPIRRSQRRRVGVARRTVAGSHAGFPHVTDKRHVAPHAPVAVGECHVTSPAASAVTWLQVVGERAGVCGGSERQQEVNDDWQQTTNHARVTACHLTTTVVHWRPTSSSSSTTTNNKVTAGPKQNVSSECQIIKSV